MDPKPFRCVYDPELSRSKSQGSKPIYSKPRIGHASSDPRREYERERAKEGSKRTPPRATLPLPEFAKKVAKPPRRCLLTGIDPLVSRGKLYDLVGQYGQVEDCQISVSKTTGASLGIGWVIYKPNQPVAVSDLIKSSEQGLITINDLGSRVQIKPDNSGDLLKEAERVAEKKAVPQLLSHSSVNGITSYDSNGHQDGRHSVGSGTGTDRKDEPRMVELRTLSPSQVTQWYDKYLGPNPTYILIRDVCVSVWDYSVEKVSSVFREFPVKHIAVNRTGFFIVFDKPEDAVDCYLKMHRKVHLGGPLRLKMTLKGQRLKHEDVLEFRKNDIRNQAGKLPTAPNNVSKTLRPGRPIIDPEELEEAGVRLLTDLSQEMKRSAWPTLLLDFVNSIVEEELQKMWKKEDELHSQNRQGSIIGDDDEAGSDTDTISSRESTPVNASAEGQEPMSATTAAPAVGFGIRRGQATGMTARVLPGYGVVRPFSLLPGLKIRKRFSETPLSSPPSTKKRKALHVTASAPNSYIRAPIKADPKNGLVKMEISDKPSNSHLGDVKMGIAHDKNNSEADNDDKAESDEDANEDENDDNDYDNDNDYDSSRKVNGNGIESSHIGGLESLKIDNSMDVDEPLKHEDETGDGRQMSIDDDIDDEESDDDLRGMALPISPTSEATSPQAFDITYHYIQRLVKSQEDYLCLRHHLDSLPLKELSEDEISELISEASRPKLNVDSNDLPMKNPNDLPFRLAPYRNRTDDERRGYLQNSGPGVPNEIVQSYKERPLYEGADEIEEEESRTDTKALNVSRSAFGVNADLFADDNLSKNAKDTRLARSAIHDWGLYANEPIPSNDFVIEYVGDVLRDEYAEIRERNYAMEGIDSTYLFRLDNGTVIDATKRGNGARFINHSCDPNCTAQVFDYEGFKRVALFALRDIEPDEELTFDYNFVKSQDEDGRVRCACGAANCRGWLM